MNKKTDIKKFVVNRILLSKLFTLVLLLAIVLAVFTILTPALNKGVYFSVRNIRNILNSMAVVAFLTVGAGMLLVSGYLDLSTGAIGTLSGILMAMVLQAGLSWPFAVVIPLVAAGCIGFMNALMINRFKLQAFIATMAVASIVSGVVYIITGGKSIPIKDPVIAYVGTQMIFDILPVSVLLALLAFVIYGVILAKTNFGMKVYLVGGNPQAARLAGLNPRRVSFILFINNAMLGGMSGMLFCARMKMGSVGATGLQSNQFAGLTASILGGISFGGGEGGLLGAFVGLMILNSFSNGMSVIGLSNYLQTVASGVLLLVALTFDFVLQRSRMRRKA